LTNSQQLFDISKDVLDLIWSNSTKSFLVVHKANSHIPAYSCYIAFCRTILAMLLFHLEYHYFEYKKLSYCRGTARRSMLVSSCYVSRSMGR